MVFRNSVVGGTTLVRPAIKSPNYVAGVSGWSINADGSAEFNDLTIRGEFRGTNFIMNEDGLFFYDGTPAAGNLILSIADSAGTDEFGNAYVAGLGVYSADGTVQAFDTGVIWDNDLGSRIEIDAGGAQALMQLTPRDVVGVTWDTASIGTNIVTDFGASTPTLFLQSPSDSVNNAKSSIQLLGGSPSLSDSRIDMNGNLRLLDQITQYDSDTFTSYSPVITGGGTATFTMTGWWQRIGQMIFFTASAAVTAVGSGAATLSITGPVSIDRTTRQVVAGHIDGTGSGINGTAALVSFVGGAGAVFDRIRTDDGANITGVNLDTIGATLTFTGWYREA